jgi:RNA polymerase sigma-70 factor (ECF subfamily)
VDRDAVATHIPRLRRYARALIGDRMLADDLVQDALERVLAKHHLWRPGSDLRAWLFSIMHGVYVNQVRARKPVAVPLDERRDRVGHHAEGSAGLALRDLETALAQLPEEQRAVVLLVGLEELTYADAARALGIPIGTVMSRLSRGRERLRQLLSGARSLPSLKVVK